MTGCGHLRTFRADLGLTQLAAARLFGIPAARYGRLERGGGWVTRAERSKIAERLGMAPETLHLPLHDDNDGERRGNFWDPEEETLHQQFARRLRNIRRQSGISAESLARSLGVPPAQIRRYENGEVKLPVTRLYIIAEKLGARPEQFLVTAQILRPAATRALRERDPDQVARILTAAEEIESLPQHRKEAILQLLQCLRSDGCGAATP